MGPGQLSGQIAGIGQPATGIADVSLPRAQSRLNDLNDRLTKLSNSMESVSSGIVGSQPPLHPPTQEAICPGLNGHLEMLHHNLYHANSVLDDIEVYLLRIQSVL